MGLTTDTHGPRGLRLWTLVRANTTVWAAALVGLALGLVISVDAAVVDRIPGGDFRIHREIPFLLTISFLAVLAAAVAFARFGRHLFARRLDLALVGIMAAVSVSGFGGSLEATDLVVPAVLLLWLFAAIVEQRPVRVPRLALLLALVLLAFCVGSIANGGIKAMLAMVRPVKVLLLAFLVADLIDGPHRCRLAVRWFVILALLSAAIAVFTGVLDMTTGVSLTAWDDARYQAKETPFGLMMRATALQSTAQVLAHFLLLGVALFLPSRTRPVGKLAGVLLLSVGILLTWSSGAYVMLAIALALWLFMSRPRLSIHYVVTTVGVAVFLYASGAATWLWDHGFTVLGSDPADDRLVQMRNVIGGIAGHPFLGSGVAAWIRGSEGSVHVHNVYLQAATEIGIPASLLLIGMLLALMVAAAVVIPGLAKQQDRDICKGVILGLFVLGLHWNVEPFLYCPVSWLFIGIATGVVAHYGREAASTRRRRSIKPAPTAGPGRTTGALAPS